MNFLPRRDMYHVINDTPFYIYYAWHTDPNCLHFVINKRIDKRINILKYLLFGAFGLDASGDNFRHFFLANNCAPYIGRTQVYPYYFGTHYTLSFLSKTV